MTELHDATFGWLCARLREVHAERQALPETLSCVEPPSAGDRLRETIERDYQLIRDELAERRHLVQSLSVYALEDGCRLLLIPPPD